MASLDVSQSPVLPSSSNQESSALLGDWKPPDSASRLHPYPSDEENITTPAFFTWMLAVGAGISGLLFGYDTGVISATLVGIGPDLTGTALTTVEKSVITSCTSLCAFVANPFMGVLTDKYGRWWIIVLADFLFILGSLLQAVAHNVETMVVGRSLVGVAIGGASFVVPLYISELSPAQFRGRLVMISTLFITGGQVVAYVAGWLLSETKSGWRTLVALGAAPAVLQLLFTVRMPETPRWLMASGDSRRARKVLSSVYDKHEMDSSIEAILHKIDEELSREERDIRMLCPNVPINRGSGGTIMFKARLGELFRAGPSQRALVIACLLQGLQQLCGFNSLMYFSATIFSLVGFNSPTLPSLAIATTNFLFTLVAFHTIDRVGRRRTLLYSIPLLAFALSSCALVFTHVKIAFDLEPEDETSKNGIFWPSMVLVSMVVYVAAYAIGLGNVPWQQSELFPLSVRSLGSSFATAVNWGSNFIVGMTFLPMLDLLSGPVTFGTYAAVCMVGWLMVWRIYPETAGLSLEDVHSLLQNSWGVAESMSKFSERRAT